MVKKTLKKFCYLTPNFPKKGYFAAVFFSSTKNPLWILPVSAVSQNMDEITDSIVEIIQEAGKNIASKIRFLEDAIFFPIKFQKLIPLKEEYWTRCQVNPDFQDKILAFAPAVMTPNLYKLLVVPYSYLEKEKHWQFCAAYPFSVFSDDQEIEQFMYGSDQKVEIKAKYAAAYSLGAGKRLNWKTGEIKEFEIPISSKPKIIN